MPKLMSSQNCNETIWCCTVQRTTQKPRLLPIKNVLSPIERQLKEDAVVLNITQELHNDFLERVQETMCN